MHIGVNVPRTVGLALAKISAGEVPPRNVLAKNRREVCFRRTNTKYWRNLTKSTGKYPTQNTGEIQREALAKNRREMCWRRTGAKCVGEKLMSVQAKNRR
jgi:hypothetical protein